MAREIPDQYGSKFRFIVIASQRALQLQNGARPKLSVKSEKPAYIAIREAEANLIKWEQLVGGDDSEAEEETSK